MSQIENRLIRMQEDLRKSMQKPINQRSWVMVIDVDKCIGCHACTVACMAENALPPGVSYRVVYDTEDGEFPNVRRFSCRQTVSNVTTPPASKVCPKSSIPSALTVSWFSTMKK